MERYPDIKEDVGHCKAIQDIVLRQKEKCKL